MSARARLLAAAATLALVASLTNALLPAHSGEAAPVEVNDRRTGRMAYRVEAVLSTDGPRLKMTFFAKNKHMADWHQSRVAVGRRGVFLGRADRFRDAWQLVNPDLTIFGLADDEVARITVES